MFDKYFYNSTDSQSFIDYMVFILNVPFIDSELTEANTTGYGRETTNIWPYMERQYCDGK